VPQNPACKCKHEANYKHQKANNKQIQKKSKSKTRLDPRLREDDKLLISVQRRAFSNIGGQEYLPTLRVAQISFIF